MLEEKDLNLHANYSTEDVGIEVRLKRMILTIHSSYVLSLQSRILIYLQTKCKKNVEDLHECLEISCVGYEEQLKALLIAIETKRSIDVKSAIKRDRELKHLKRSINYDFKEEIVGRDRSKWREFLFCNKA